MKKVSFSEDVEVKDISVDYDEHINEIKNPQSFIVEKSQDMDDDVIVLDDDNKFNTNILLLILGVICISIIFYLIWKYFKS